MGKIMLYKIIGTVGLVTLALILTPVDLMSNEKGSMFKDVTESAGLKGVKDIGTIACADYNNDGYQDILINGRQLFKNNGPEKWDFIDVTKEVGLESKERGGSWVDFDNDGDLDLLIFGKKETLWRNTGKPDYKFVDVTEKSGIINDNAATTGAVWLDYDRDGYPDLYLVNYQGKKGYIANRLLHNEKGKFVDVTKKMGMDKEINSPLPSRSAVVGDYNNDGFVDIYVSNYRLKKNYLWENQKGKSFKDVAEKLNVQGIKRRGYYGHTIASVFGDINNDGALDLIVGNFAHKDTQTGRGYICDDAKIYLNLGQEEQYKFLDIREKAGIPIKGLDTGDETICGTALGDFDNDGLLDLYITQTYDQLPWAYSWLYHNETNDGVKFKDITVSAGVRVWDTYNCIPIDYDNDGDLDLITGGKLVKDRKAPHLIRLFRNETGNKNNYLKVKVKGRDCNKSGLGARLTIYYDKKIQTREIGTGLTSSSSSPLVACFGLGT